MNKIGEFWFYFIGSEDENMTPDEVYESYTKEILDAKLDERYDSEEYETTTLYFSAPKEYLKGMIPNRDYPDAVSMEISIEFPTDCAEAKYSSVCVSPTRETEDGTEDYDWNDVELPYDVIEALIALADKSIKRSCMEDCKKLSD